MKTPKVIYLLDPLFCRTEKLFANDVAYFSEENIRRVLTQCIEEAYPIEMRRSKMFINGLVQSFVDKLQKE